jgi:hypothetical protein
MIFFFALRGHAPFTAISVGKQMGISFMSSGATLIGFTRLSMSLDTK